MQNNDSDKKSFKLLSPTSNVSNNNNNSNDTDDLLETKVKEGKATPAEFLAICDSQRHKTTKDFLRRLLGNDPREFLAKYGDRHYKRVENLFNFICLIKGKVDLNKVIDLIKTPDSYDVLKNKLNDLILEKDNSEHKKIIYFIAGTYFIINNYSGAAYYFYYEINYIDNNFLTIKQDLLTLAFEYLFYSGNYDEALSIISNNPLSIQDSLIFYFKKNYGQTILLCAKLLSAESGPTSGFFLFLTALSHLQLEQYTKAGKIFDKYVKTYSNSITALKSAAIYLEFYGKTPAEKQLAENFHAKADALIVQNYTKATCDQEKLAISYVCFGDMYFRVGQIKRAREMYEKAIAVNTFTHGFHYAQEAIKEIEKIEASQSATNMDVAKGQDTDASWFYHEQILYNFGGTNNNNPSLAPDLLKRVKENRATPQEFLDILQRFPYISFILDSTLNEKCSLFINKNPQHYPLIVSLFSELSIFEFNVYGGMLYDSLKQAKISISPHSELKKNLRATIS